MARDLLTDAKIKRLQPGEHGDGDGLHIRVRKSAAGGLRLSWTFQYVVAGKRRRLGLGPCPAVTLDAARAQRDALQGGRQRGIDPEAFLARQTTTKNAPTVSEAVLAAYERRAPGMKNGSRWLSSLRTHVLPVVGDRDITSVTADELLAIFKPIWTEIPEAASKSLLRLKIAYEDCEADEVPVDVAMLDRVKRLLGSQKRAQKGHAAAPCDEVAALRFTLGGLRKLGIGFEDNYCELSVFDESGEAPSTNKDDLSFLISELQKLRHRFKAGDVAPVEGAGSCLRDAAKAKALWAEASQQIRFLRGLREACTDLLRHEGTGALKVDIDTAELATVAPVLVGKNGGEKKLKIKVSRRIRYDPQLSEIPKLVMDATIDPAIAKEWLPNLTMVAEVAIADGPGVIRLNTLGESFATSKLVSDEGAWKEKLKQAGGVALAAKHWKGDSSLICLPKKAEGKLAEAPELNGLNFGHQGGLRGSNAHENAPALVQIGRSVPGVRTVEEIAETIFGRKLDNPIEDIYLDPEGLNSAGKKGVTLFHEGEGPVPAHWKNLGPYYPLRREVVERRDGSSVWAPSPYHPDPMAEIVRRAITEGEAAQNNGRVREIHRTEQHPVLIVNLNNASPDKPIDAVISLEELAFYSTPLHALMVGGIYPIGHRRGFVAACVVAQEAIIELQDLSGFDVVDFPESAVELAELKKMAEREGRPLSTLEIAAFETRAAVGHRAQRAAGMPSPAEDSSAAEMEPLKTRRTGKYLGDLLKDHRVAGLIHDVLRHRPEGKTWEEAAEARHVLECRYPLAHHLGIAEALWGHQLVKITTPGTNRTCDALVDAQTPGEAVRRCERVFPVGTKITALPDGKPPKRRRGRPAKDAPNPDAPIEGNGAVPWRLRTPRGEVSPARGRDARYESVGLQCRSGGVNSDRSSPAAPPAAPLELV